MACPDGTYQFASKTGSAAEFVAGLPADLKARFAGLIPGEPSLLGGLGGDRGGKCRALRQAAARPHQGAVLRLAGGPGEDGDDVRRQHAILGAAELLLVDGGPARRCRAARRSSRAFSRGFWPAQRRSRRTARRSMRPPFRASMPSAAGATATGSSSSSARIAGTSRNWSPTASRANSPTPSRCWVVPRPQE